MTSTERLTRISPAALDGLLAQARAEHWTQLVLLGPGPWVSDDVEHWPGEWKAAPRIFQLTDLVKGLAGKFQTLKDLTSLDLSNTGIGAEGAKAIAGSLKDLTSLDLSHTGIGAEGAKAIAASLKDLTSLDLSHNSIGAPRAPRPSPLRSKTSPRLVFRTTASATWAPRPSPERSTASPRCI